MSLPTAPSRLRIAYLLSRYPAAGMRFYSLGTLEFDIEIVSINPPDGVKGATRVELSESRKAYYIKLESIC